MQVSRICITIFTLLLVSSSSLMAQLKVDHVWNNKLRVRYLKTSDWKASFSLGNRADFTEVFKSDSEDNDNLDFNFVELKHELTYDLDDKFDIGLETRFRYRSVFDDGKGNEIRISPYLILTNKNGVKEHSYELKMEIRRKPKSLAYRVRLVHQLEQPFRSQLRKDDPVKWFVGTALLSQFEADEQTSVELRNELGISATILNALDLSLSIQLRNEYDFDDIDTALFYGTGLGYKF